VEGLRVSLKAAAIGALAILGLLGAGCGQNSTPEKLGLEDLGETYIQKILGPQQEKTEALYAGQVVLGSGVRPPQGAKLFLIVRLESPKGQMVGGKLLDAPSFPLPFEVNGGDLFAPSDSLSSRPVFLAARMDQDGDPMTRQPGDLEAATQAPVTIGQKKIVLVLSGS
jgi:hypothetical protein